MDAPSTGGTSGSPPRSAAWTRAEAANPVLVADLTLEWTDVFMTRTACST